MGIKACNPAAWAAEFGYDTVTENRVRPRVVSPDLQQQRVGVGVPSECVGLSGHLSGGGALPLMALYFMLTIYESFARMEQAKAGCRRIAERNYYSRVVLSRLSFCTTMNLLP